MRKRLFLLSGVLLTFLTVSADVSPNPIRIKGIVSKQPVNIQMVSEIVRVDLFKDSSIVECSFNMKNLGQASEIEVGFPMMNFYHWSDDKSNDLNKDKFQVWVRGEAVNKVNIYIPDELKGLFLKKADRSGGYSEELYKELRLYENENKPWYLWKTRFNKDESMQIIVRYSLPTGANKLNRFFNYILSTGAGWKGNIEQADVIVTVKDFAMDQLIKMSPSNYVKKENQLIWRFKDLEPDSDDDIFIDYEDVKGSYKERLAKMKANSPTFYIDNVKTDSISELEQLSKIAKLSISKTRNDTDKNGSVHIFTDIFAFSSFLKKIRSAFPKIYQQLSQETAEGIKGNYVLIVNDREIKQDLMLGKLLDLNNSKLLSIKILKAIDNRKVISIKEKV
jgi:hypothetical protein